MEQYFPQEKITKTEKESRTEQAEKVVRFLDRINAFEYVKKILKDEEGVERPDFEQFKDFLTRINGIARDIPIRERRIDGDGVQLSGFVEDVVVPRHEDRENLLQYACEQSRLIDKDNLKYLLPAAINAVHLFADGNGRTSRAIHLLLRDYSSKEEFEGELKKALGEDGRFDSFDINPGLIGHNLQQEVLKNHGWIYNEEYPHGALGPIKAGIASVEVRVLEKEHPSYEAARELFKLAADNGRQVLTAIYMEIGDEVSNLMSEYGDEKTLLLSPKKTLQSLSPEQWQKITDNFYQLKKEQVETLVNIFTYPEEYPSSDNGGETLRDVFIREIQEQKDTD